MSRRAIVRATRIIALHLALTIVLVGPLGALGAAIALFLAGSAVDAVSFAIAQRQYRIAWEWPFVAVVMAVLYAGLVWVLIDKSSASAGNPSQRIYVGVSTTAGNKIYRSADGGATWNAMPGQPTTSAWFPTSTPCNGVIQPQPRATPSSSLGRAQPV